MSDTDIICDADIDMDWEKVSELPHYYIVNSTYDFLRLTAYAMLKPIGTVRDERGWYALFKYCKEIKYIDKYIEDYQFSDEQWSELRSSLRPQDRTYYELLEKYDKIMVKQHREAKQ